MTKQYFVYILTNKRHGTLYIGVTSDLIKRIWQHKERNIEGFTSKYGLKTLVYFEQHDTPEEAIKREKNMKAWQRSWKIKLIERRNPEWHDLYDEIIG